jgi:hypothetical protein
MVTDMLARHDEQTGLEVGPEQACCWVQFVIPLAIAAYQALANRGKKEGIADPDSAAYPQYQQMQSLVNEDVRRMHAAQPVQDAILRMAMGMLPTYARNDPGFSQFTGLGGQQVAKRKAPPDDREVPPFR